MPSWLPPVAEVNSDALLARPSVAIQRRHTPRAGIAARRVGAGIGVQ
jgi:hypothetical protein